MNVSRTSFGFGGRTARGFAVDSGLARAFTIGLLGLMALAGTGIAPPEVSPTEAVDGTITEVIHILDAEALKLPERSRERREEIERVLRQRINYEQMARRALGPTWADLASTERQEFVDLFVKLLRDTFANRICEYSGEQIRYISERREGGSAEVSTSLIGRKVDTPMVFRLDSQSGDWLVYDIVIDGASIVHNYRAQFTSILREVPFAGLLTKLHHNTVLVKEFEKAARP